MSARPRLRQQRIELSEFEARLINELQAGFPIASRPFDILARRLDRPAADIMTCIRDLLARGIATRFGPLFNIETIGGVFSLCALKVPAERFDQVADIVNGYPQVAHNYERDHEWNMWFVLATESEGELEGVFAQILDRSACPGMNLPKQREFYVGLELHAEAGVAY